MYSCKLTILSTNAASGEVDTKDFSGVNQNYIAQIGGNAVELPEGYSTFWAWADAVARSINSLTTGTYYNSRVQAIFDINQEVAE